MLLLHSFSEFEAFADSVRDADMRFTMRELYLPQWNLYQLEIGPIHIQVGLEGSGRIAEGSSRLDGWLSLSA